MNGVVLDLYYDFYMDCGFVMIVILIWVMQEILVRKENKMDSLEIVGVVLIVLGILFFAPLVTIWSLNMLFGLSIPIKLSTWFATLWLGTIIASSKQSK